MGWRWNATAVVMIGAAVGVTVLRLKGCTVTSLGFVIRRLLDPAILQSSLGLAILQGTQTNGIPQIKAAGTLHNGLAEGQWRAFHEVRWKL